jgi:hypothetical protein
MDFDLKLQAKDVFREILWEGKFEQIAIWLDGEWSAFDSVHYKERKKEEEPIYILHEKEILEALNTNFLDEGIEFLIQKIEGILNEQAWKYPTDY